jgi:hypothetical protein
MNVAPTESLRQLRHEFDLRAIPLFGDITGLSNHAESPPAL